MSKGRDKRKIAKANAAKRKGIGCKPKQEMIDKIARKAMQVLADKRSQ